MSTVETSVLISYILERTQPSQQYAERKFVPSSLLNSSDEDYFADHSEQEESDYYEDDDDDVCQANSSSKFGQLQISPIDRSDDEESIGHFEQDESSYSEFGSGTDDEIVAAIGPYRRRRKVKLSTDISGLFLCEKKEVEVEDIRGRNCIDDADKKAEWVSENFRVATPWQTAESARIREFDFESMTDKRHRNNKICCNEGIFQSQMCV